MRPFEWLTSPLSLRPLLLKALNAAEEDDDDDETKDSNNTSGQQQEHRQSKKDSSKKRKVLHVGSGSSALGEYLLEDPKFRRMISQVVNVDCDANTLQSMEKRWKQKQRANDSVHHDDDDDEEKEMSNEAMSFVNFDFAPDDDSMLEYPDGWFDLVVDKSTLDCTLCSDRATAGLLLEVYRLLKSCDGDSGTSTGRGGVYLVVSFHHVDLLKPLLQVPGFDWEIECHVLERQVEDLVSKNHTTASSQNNAIGITTSNVNAPSSTLMMQSIATAAIPAQAPPPWSNGTFEPDETYRRTVNVLLCRKCSSSSSSSRGETTSTSNHHLEVLPDRETVSTHVHAINDRWYQSQNPMLTRVREKEIARAFEEHLQQLQLQRDDGGSQPRQSSAVAVVDVHEGYRILFTVEEQEQYTFDLFLEDWNAYCDNMNHDLHLDNKDMMSYESAIHFLAEMQ